MLAIKVHKAGASARRGSACYDVLSAKTLDGCWGFGGSRCRSKLSSQQIAAQGVTIDGCMKRFLVLLALAGVVGLAQAPNKCGDFGSRFQMPGNRIEITRAEMVPAGQAPGGRGGLAGPVLPARCRVDGVIDRRTGPDGKTYGIRFAIALPENWSGQFLQQGGGGLNGTVAEPTGAQAAGDRPALARGFAVATSDTGHQERAAVGSMGALCRINKPPSILSLPCGDRTVDRSGEAGSWEAGYGRLRRRTPMYVGLFHGRARSDAHVLNRYQLYFPMEWWLGTPASAYEVIANLATPRLQRNAERCHLHPKLMANGRPGPALSRRAIRKR